MKSIKSIKKIITLILSIAMIFTLLPSAITAAAEDEMSPTQAMIIGDNLMVEEYGYDSTQGTRTEFDPSANLGTGWSGSWVNNGTKLRFYYDTSWRTQIACAEYFGSGSLERSFANAIDFSKDGKYVICFKDRSFQGTGNNVTFRSGTTEIFKTYMKDNGRTLQLIAGSASTDLSAQFDGELYQNKIEITVNSSGEDSIKMKKYKPGESEPDDYFLELNCELSDKSIDNVKIWYYAGGLADIQIYSSEISFGKKVVEGKGTDVQKLNDNKADTVWTAQNGDYAIIDMEKPVKITSAEFKGVSGSFELFASLNGCLSDITKIADISSDEIIDITENTVGRYIIVKGEGTFGEIDLWGDSYPDDVLNVPDILIGNKPVYGNKVILSSNEKIVVDFSESVNATESSVELTVDGKSVPVSVSVADDKITLFTSKALEGDCVLTVKSDITNESGKTFGGGADYVHKFTGVKDIEINGSTVKNNSESDVTLIPLKTGDSVTEEAEVTVKAGESPSFDGDILINDWESFSPASVKKAASNTITLNEEIEVDKTDCTAKITGVVKGENMQTIGGREVLIALTPVSDSLSASKIVALKKVISADDGSFTAILTLDKNLSGFFKPYASTNYSSVPATGKFYFISDTGEETVLDAFDKADTTAKMEAAIKGNLASLGIEESSYSVKIDTLISQIGDEMLANKSSYSDVTKIASAVRSGLVTAEVKSCENSDAVKKILNEKYEDFNADNTGWNKLGDNRTKVAENVFDNRDSIKTADDLKALYKTAVEEQLQAISPITAPEISVSDVSANVGESVNLSVKTNNALINSLSMEILYDTEYLSYEKAENNDINADITDDDGKLEILLPEKGLNENSYSLKSAHKLTLDFMPEKNSAFSAKAEISAKVSVYDENLGIVRTYDFAFEPSISVTQKSGESGSSSSTSTSSKGNKKGNYTGSYTPVGGVSSGSNETEEEKISFTDLENFDWAMEAISYLAENEIVNGVSEKEFAPNVNVKREEFAKILVLAFNLYNEEATCNFDDVKKDDWYYSYVASAVESGIVNGVSEAHFGAGEYLTREQMTAMLYRVIMKFAPYVEYEKEVEFEDYADISEYAREAVDAMSYFGAVNGMGGNCFMPKGTATRSQSAVIVYRVLKLFDESIGK